GRELPGGVAEAPQPAGGLDPRPGLAGPGRGSGLRRRLRLRGERPAAPGAARRPRAGESADPTAGEAVPGAATPVAAAGERPLGRPLLLRQPGCRGGAHPGRPGRRRRVRLGHAKDHRHPAPEPPAGLRRQAAGPPRRSRGVRGPHPGRQRRRQLRGGQPAGEPRGLAPGGRVRPGARGGGPDPRPLGGPRGVPRDPFQEHRPRGRARAGLPPGPRSPRSEPAHPQRNLPERGKVLPRPELDLPGKLLRRGRRGRRSRPANGRGAGRARRGGVRHRPRRAGGPDLPQAGRRL
ncbi:MAG: hypothetical protein AVDCRST_MAG02-3949, partial [uncultured Rubrobacteraceae bacterium]